MQRIIFFDGVCNLCDLVVSRVFKIDKNHRFLYASLQSETARKLLKTGDIAKDSIVFYEAGKTYYYADAVIRILNTLGGVYRLISWILRVFPRPLRDFAYRLVAANRYRLFGQKAECRLATEAEKDYFLD